MVTLKPTESGTLEMKQYHDMSGQPNPDMFRNTLHLSLCVRLNFNVSKMSDIASCVMDNTSCKKIEILGSRPHTPFTH